MSNFLAGCLAGWIVGSTGTAFAISLITGRARHDVHTPRPLPLDYDGEPDDA